MKTKLESLSKKIDQFSTFDFKNATSFAKAAMNSAQLKQEVRSSFFNGWLKLMGQAKNIFEYFPIRSWFRL